MIRWILNRRRWAVVALSPNDGMAIVSRHWTKADALISMGLEENIRICRIRQIDRELME